MGRDGQNGHGTQTQRSRAARWLFHQLTVKDYEWVPGSRALTATEHRASARQYLDRFGDRLQVAGLTALDVGCGNGQLCFELARRGARRVVGADLDPGFGREELERQEPGIRDRVEFLRTQGSLRELGSERFDLVFSKDSFEHFAEPEEVVRTMMSVLAPGGRLVIGFGPLWKAPTGGHIDFMTKVPWAHLLFPEHVVMAERRRFRPEEAVARFEDIKGGLNKMTLARFEEIMSASRLACRWQDTNVSDNRVVQLMDRVASVPPLREYFTANVYGIWQMPSA